MREPTREEWRDWTLAIEPHKPSNYEMLLRLSGMPAEQAQLAAYYGEMQARCANQQQMHGLSGTYSLLDNLLGNGAAKMILGG